MFLLLQSLCTNVILGILVMIMCVYICVVLEGMYTWKTGYFVNNPLCLCLCCCIQYVKVQDLGFCKYSCVFKCLQLQRVWTHVTLGILARSHFVYVCIVLEGMYTCKTGNFGNKPLYLYFLLLQRVCKNVKLGVFATSLCVYVCVVVDVMYTCHTGYFGNKHFCL